MKLLAEVIETQFEASGTCTCGGCVKGKNALDQYNAILTK